jgi:hypothetical protein
LERCICNLCLATVEPFDLYGLPLLTEGSQDEPIQQHHIALDFGDGGMRDPLSDYHDALRVIIIAEW